MNEKISKEAFFFEVIDDNQLNQYSGGAQGRNYLSTAGTHNSCNKDGTNDLACIRIDSNKPRK